MVSFYNRERKEQFFRLYNRKWDSNTFHFASPQWLSYVPSDSIIRISNLPSFISDIELLQKLLKICGYAGQVVGFAGYYLPPMHRNCQFVLIGFVNATVASIATNGLQRYLWANSFLTVEKIEDFSFCITHSGEDNNFYSVYADPLDLKRLHE